MALPAGRRCSSAWEGKGKRVDENTQSFRAHLFTVRVWRDDMGDGQWEWRGKVQHVDSGEAFYFREWQELIAHLKTWLQEESQWVYRPR
jgi:hypothetical protein